MRYKNWSVHIEQKIMRNEHRSIQIELKRTWIEHLAMHIDRDLMH